MFVDSLLYRSEDASRVSQPVSRFTLFTALMKLKIESQCHTTWLSRFLSLSLSPPLSETDGSRTLTLAERPSEDACARERAGGRDR